MRSPKRPFSKDVGRHHLHLLSRRKPSGGLRRGYLTPAGWYGDPLVIEDPKLRLEALRRQAKPRLPGDRPRVQKKIPLPKWTDKRGWVGGDTYRLFAFTDKLTGRVVVAPGNRGLRHVCIPVGDNATVRPATRSEAEEHWQSPLHSGWKVEED